MMHVNDDEEDAMDTVSHVSLALSLISYSFSIL